MIRSISRIFPFSRRLMMAIEKVKVNDEEIESFLPGIYRKLEWLSKEDLIKRVVSMEFNRFLEY